NELVVTRHGAEATGHPVGLGLLDAVRTAGDEVPPEVARAIQRRAAQQHDDAVFVGVDLHGRMPLQYQQSAATVALAAHGNAAHGDIQRLLIRQHRYLHAALGAEADFGIERLAGGHYGRLPAEGLAGDQRDADARLLD